MDSEAFFLEFFKLKIVSTVVLLVKYVAKNVNVQLEMKSLMLLTF